MVLSTLQGDVLVVKPHGTLLLKSSPEKETFSVRAFRGQQRWGQLDGDEWREYTGLVNIQKAMENGYRKSGFSH